MFYTADDTFDNFSNKSEINSFIADSYKRLSNVSILRKTIHLIEDKLNRELNFNERDNLKNMINEDGNSAYLHRRNPNSFYLGNVKKSSDNSNNDEYIIKTVLQFQLRLDKYYQ